jgi:hypothetical protein
MEYMLWIEDIIESTLVHSFFTNFYVDMADFAYPHKVVHKVVVRRSAFTTFSSVQMEVN